ncbi:20476_t:CDS:1, partial [Funneliformis geosporum]
GERELLPIGFDNEGHGQLIFTGDVTKVEGQKISIFKDQVSDEKLDFPNSNQPDDQMATLLTIPFIQFEITGLKKRNNQLRNWY